MDLMDLAQKLQRLRKARGLSQEQLADKIGVSRQAVSKWESAQAVPDVDKIVLLSEYFGVTTDYLLKKEEAEHAAAPVTAAVQEKAKPDAMSFALAGTALDLMGLLVAVLLWEDCRTQLGTEALATTAGVLLMIAGCTVFGVGQLRSNAAAKLRAKRSFWAVNGGLLCYLPLVYLYNRLALGADYDFVSYRHAPLPVGWMASSDSVIYIWPQRLFWVAYAAVCVGLAAFQWRRYQAERQDSRKTEE